MDSLDEPQRSYSRNKDSRKGVFRSAESETAHTTRHSGREALRLLVELNRHWRMRTLEWPSPQFRRVPLADAARQRGRETPSTVSLLGRLKTGNALRDAFD